MKYYSALTLNYRLNGDDKMRMEVNGLKELRNDLKHKPERLKEDLKQVVYNNTLALQREAIRQAQFGRYTKKKYTRGNLRRSIRFKISKNGLLGEVAPHVKYASYVEYGTGKMREQPYMRPAFDNIKPKFINDIRNLSK